MSIYIAVAALTYLILLVLAYVAIIVTSVEEEKSETIINKAYKNAYSILAFGLLVVYILFRLPHITIDYHTTSYLIIASKYLSVITLAGSLFVFSRKKSQQ